MARKVIGLLSAGPENTYAARLVEGIAMRCRTYGYDVAVFAVLPALGTAQEKYMAGEMNIYTLLNPDRIDGLVVDVFSLTDSSSLQLIPAITSLVKECPKPVVAVGGVMGNYPAFVPANRRVFRELVEHVIVKHGCRKLYFLGGPEGNAETIDRLSGFADALSAYDIPFDEQNVFYGDFWYSGGAALAKRILSGELERPQAVICASDHMAIGLTNHLVEGGLRVPEDIIVTGFDATQDSAINRVTITSMPADIEGVAVSGVDQLRMLMEPGAALAPYTPNDQKKLRTGMSCGCNSDMSQIMEQLRLSLYNVNHDYSSVDVVADIGMLIESNMVEYLSGCDTPKECIHQVYNHTYLMGDYDEFYLCLEENWLNADLCCQEGYPRQIKMVVNNTPALGSGHYEDGYVFDTALMLPDLGSESVKPSLYYFMAVHFLDQSMGYAVLRHELQHVQPMSCVIRNWVKNISTGLHISRTTHRLASLSTRDGMTGVYNRRGMELMLDQMLRRAGPEDSVLAFVIDMDRLKEINDTFGHADGDFAINAISAAARRITGSGELCIRAGGDEFYIIGIGSYSPQEAENRIALFRQAMKEINATLHKPYTISASIGSACIPLASGMTVMGIIRIADAKMYENKVQKKLQRQG